MSGANFFIVFLEKWLPVLKKQLEDFDSWLAIPSANHLKQVASPRALMRRVCQCFVWPRMRSVGELIEEHKQTLAKTTASSLDEDTTHRKFVLWLKITEEITICDCYFRSNEFVDMLIYYAHSLDCIAESDCFRVFTLLPVSHNYWNVKKHVTTDLKVIKKQL